MELQEKRGLYSIFKIVNEKPGAKNKAYYFVTGVYDDPEKVKTRIRGIAKSKAIRGGAKTISSAMANDGEDYEDHFKVTRVAKGLDKTSALEMRNNLKEKLPPKKIYNKPR